MPRAVLNCATCGQPMKRQGGWWRAVCDCWRCPCCGEAMRKDQDCGCWPCPCMANFGDGLESNLAGQPCWSCGHDRGACNCSMPCAAGCGFLHPPGHVCNYAEAMAERAASYGDDEIPF